MPMNPRSLAFAVCLVLAACGDDATGGSGGDASHPEALVGTWKRQVVKESATTTQELTLSSSGSWSSLSTISESGNRDEFPASGSWDASGDTINMRRSGEAKGGASRFTVTATTLHLSALVGSDTSTFVRQ